MATTVYGNTINGYWKVYLTYTFNGTYSATQSSLSWSYGIYWVKAIKGNSDTDGNYQTQKDRPTYVTCAGQTKYFYPTARLTNTWYGNDADKKYQYGSGTFYFTRTKAAQSITLKASSYHNSSSTTYKGTSAKSVTFTVPARTAYTISFNANGGTNPPASVTKYYGYDITLPTSTPTRNYWDFNKWNTNSSGTGTNYAPGATYSGNATAALYATWSYINPIMSGFELERMDFNEENNFSSNDEGQYLAVKFNYSSGHVPSAAASSTTTEVTAAINGNPIQVYTGSGSNFTDSFTFSGTNTAGIIKYYNLGSGPGPGSDASQAYTITFTLTEPGHVTTLTTTLSSSLYPLELSPDGLLLSTGSNMRFKKDLYILVDDIAGTDPLYIALDNIEWSDDSSIIISEN